MTDLMIGNETFRVEVVGDPAGPALVLSHALGADLSLWDAQVPALARHFRVVRFDTRGHGGSALGTAPVSIERLGKDVLAILDSLEIDTAHFIGLSMGGAIGLWLLANAPDRIGRAVLANTAPRLGSPDGWNARIAGALAGRMDDIAKATIERWFGASFAAREPQRVAKVLAGLRAVSPEGYAGCCAALRDMDLREAVRTIRHEVLVIAGHDDQTVPPADAEAFAASLEQGNHIELDARHISNIEAEAAFTAAVVDFLTAKPARRPAAKRTTKAKPAAGPSMPQVKRGGASRRSNAARSPLKKTPAKRAPAGKATVKKLAAARRRPPATVVAARRSPTTKAVPKAKTTAAKKAPAKGAKPAAAKTSTRKPAPAQKTARRPTPAATARGAVEKAKPRKGAPKKSAKPGKGVAKKLPVARRKSTTKPRRPTGRGKR